MCFYRVYADELAHCFLAYCEVHVDVRHFVECHMD